MKTCNPRYALKLSAILQKLQDTAQELGMLWLASLSGAAMSIDPCCTAWYYYYWSFSSRRQPEHLKNHLL
jgi:hypothetical protein